MPTVPSKSDHVSFSLKSEYISNIEGCVHLTSGKGG